MTLLAMALYQQIVKMVFVFDLNGTGIFIRKFDIFVF